MVMPKVGGQWGQLQTIDVDARAHDTSIEDEVSPVSPADPGGGRARCSVVGEARSCRPDAITIENLAANAEAVHGPTSEAVAMLNDRRHRRALPHKLGRAGYVPVRNPDADDGLWKIAGRRQAVYAKRHLSVARQITAARRLQGGRPWSA